MTPVLVAILVVLTAAGVYVALPKAGGQKRLLGLGLALVGLAAACVLFRVAGVTPGTQAFFYILAVGSVLCGIAMITSINPVYSALWFALVVVCVAGLFIVNNAQFLAAASVIVYAGAIVVTFLFVIMLAQQRGHAVYDRVAREPALGVLAGFVILAALLTAIIPQEKDGAAPAQAQVAGITDRHSDYLDGRVDGHVGGLGKEMFSTHLISLEIAGVLLLAALVGAVAVVSMRTKEETEADD